MLVANSLDTVPVAYNSGLLGDVAGCIAAGMLIGVRNIAGSIATAIVAGFWISLVETVVIVLFFSFIMYLFMNILGWINREND